MARLVKRTGTSPSKLEVGADTRWICACAPSKNQPLCEGSHNALRTAEEGPDLCWYDSQRRRQGRREKLEDVRGW